MTAIEYFKRMIQRHTLAIMVMLQVLLNIPFFLNKYIVMHDTSFSFRLFYFFYNDMFQFGEFPHWFPFGLYGMSSAAFLYYISPSGFLTWAIGLLLRVENVYTLFKLSLLIEQLVYLYGVWLLGRRLFKNPYAVFAFGLTSICGIVVSSQIDLNFRLFSLIPLILYFLVRFFEGDGLRHLGFAMMLFPLFLSGLPAYCIPIPLFVTLTISIALCAEAFREKRLRKIFEKDRIFAVMLLLFAAGLVYSYFEFLTISVQNKYMLTPGRSGTELTVSLDMFLHYGPYIGTGKFSELIYPYDLIKRATPSMDNTFFVGLMPLIFALYALLTVRRPLFIATITAIAMLGLLSLGDATFVAKAFYDYFPMMKYFRHIGYVVSCYNLLIPLAAGFGIERLIRSGRAESGTARKAFCAILSLLFAYEGVMYFYFTSIMMRGITLLSFAWLAAAIAGIYLVWRPRTLLAAGGVGLIIAAVAIFETLSYQGFNKYIMSPVKYSTINRAFPNRMTYSDAAVSVNRYDFPAKRSISSEGLDHARLKESWPFFAYGVHYTEDYNFLQYAPCRSKFRNDFFNVYVLDFYVNANPVSIENVWKSTGCESPRLRVLKDARMVSGNDEAKYLLSASNDFGDYPIVYFTESKSDESEETADSLADEGFNFESLMNKLYLNTPDFKPIGLENLRNIGGLVSVDKFSSNLVSMTAVVDSADGGWLYYVDAWSPRWKAYVNGIPKPIAHANIGFKALKLDQGTHKIEFRFSNPRLKFYEWIIFTVGFAIVGITMLMMIVDIAKEHRTGDVNE